MDRHTAAYATTTRGSSITGKKKKISKKKKCKNTRGKQECRGDELHVFLAETKPMKEVLRQIYGRCDKSPHTC